jgi:diaminopropionate ammonia-lyase
MTTTKSLEWINNTRARGIEISPAVDKLFPARVLGNARRLHRSIPGYNMSPLKSLSNLAETLGLGGIWIKDESARLGLNSFKVLGGSYAVYRVLQRKLGLELEHCTLDHLVEEAKRQDLMGLTFSSATDGNHGRGVAWAATHLGFKSIIYVHKLTTRPRIEAIEKLGAEVVVVDGTYDDAVRQINEDAQRNGWEVISDTSWEGYEDVPRWVMQGYSTIWSEAQEQLAAQGIVKPTHIFVQAGVGALAAATIGYYARLFGIERPQSIVVEPDEAACLYKSAEIGDGEPHTYEGDLETIMAGLACGDPSPIAWKVLWDCADVFVQCPDWVAARGMRVYAVPRAGDPFVVSGESGAVTLGALMQIMEQEEGRPLRESLNLGPDSQVLLINSEGNTDPLDFRRIVWDGGNAVPQAYRTAHGG